MKAKRPGCWITVSRRARKETSEEAEETKAVPFVEEAEEAKAVPFTEETEEPEAILSQSEDSTGKTKEPPIFTEDDLISNFPAPEEQECVTITVATDETWGYYGSDIAFSDINKGEIFNRLLWENRDNPEKTVEVLDIDIPLTERYSLPVIVKERLEVQEVLQSADGEPILDFGQNFTGFVTFSSSLSRGTEVHLAFAEELQDGDVKTDAQEEDSLIFPANADCRPILCTGRYVKISG